MAGNSDGPWGGGPRGGGGPGGEGPQLPEIDELVRKGQERLKVLMGGGGRRGRRGRSGGGDGPGLGRGTVVLIILGLAVLWAFQSFYTVKPEEKSVELFLGKYYRTGGPGLNFAPWPLVTAEVVPVTRERTVEIGKGPRGGEAELMLTGDENIVDIDFQVVWNVSDPAKFLFQLRDPVPTVEAVAESAMREVIALSELAPILNRDRGLIASRVAELVQDTLDEYDAGINVVRVNLDKADPPEPVIDAFRDVQAAEQEREQQKNLADAYANRVLAEARGQAAQILEQAEAYRARVINEAEGAASRFSSVLAAYRLAPDVTRKRLYLETLENVLGRVDKIIIDKGARSGGQEVVPYLPLNELMRKSRSGGSN